MKKALTYQISHVSTANFFDISLCTLLAGDQEFNSWKAGFGVSYWIHNKFKLDFNWVSDLGSNDFFRKSFDSKRSFFELRLGYAVDQFR